MAQSSSYDAVIVGSGPNGLAAAITLARAGRSVLVIEGGATVGGGMRTQEITLPGFRHDICSAIHPLGLGSPFFRSLPLDQFGLAWVQPELPLAHPLDDGTAVALHRSIDQTAASIGADGQAWAQLMGPLAAAWPTLAPALLGPLPLSPHLPALTRFGLNALPSARWLAEYRFQGERARALFAGLAAHSFLPLDQMLTASFGLVLGILGHAVGWPAARGGSQSIADAMARYLQSLGGDIVCRLDGGLAGRVAPVQSRAARRDAAPVAGVGRRPVADSLCAAGSPTIAMGQASSRSTMLCQSRFPGRPQSAGWPGRSTWAARWMRSRSSERSTTLGRHPERPYVLIAQQSLFDSTRAPEGKHTLWAYCHVPHGSEEDMTGRVEAQIERFAPGFRDLILARSTRTAMAMARYNPNYIGGDINGGVQDLRQLWTRPVLRWPPYATPLKGVYLCSSSTPPGGGVHGMCGYHAARVALGDALR